LKYYISSTGKKFIILAVIYAITLAVFSFISVGIYTSYKNTEKAEAEMIRNLPSTDLSGLAYYGITPGIKIGALPYEKQWEERRNIPSFNLTFEDGSYTTIYNLNGETVNRVPVKINTNPYNDYAAVTYNGKAVNERELKSFFGNDYISVKDIDGNSELIVYIDRENDLRLTLAMLSWAQDECYYSIFDKTEPYWYENHKPEIRRSFRASDVIWALNPLYIIAQLSRLSAGYSIFWTSARQFSNVDFLTFPLFSSVSLLPIIALAVFRNKQMIILNAGLIVFYVVLPIFLLFTTPMP